MLVVLLVALRQLWLQVRARQLRANYSIWVWARNRNRDVMAGLCAREQALLFATIRPAPMSKKTAARVSCLEMKEARKAQKSGTGHASGEEKECVDRTGLEPVTQEL